MSYTSIIISFSVQTFLLIYASSLLTKKELYIVKTYLFGYGLINAFFLGMYPLVVSLNPNTINSFQPVGTALFTINLFVLLGFIYLYGGYMIRHTTDFVINWKKGGKE